MFLSAGEKCKSDFKSTYINQNERWRNQKKKKKGVEMRELAVSRAREGGSAPVA